MQQTLTDFRIESDRVVCLTFGNGCSYRVDAKDLDRFLSSQDLRRVRRALRLRQQFMQRVLPPTILVILLAAIIGLGRYDVYQAARSWLAPLPFRTTMPASKTVPVTAGQSSSSQKSHLTVVPAAATAASSSATAATSGGTPTSAARTVTHPATPSGTGTTTVNTPVTRSAPALVQTLTQPAPISQTTQALSPILGPVTTPLTHAVQQLPNLLP
jgi:hypothetical protein